MDMNLYDRIVEFAGAIERGEPLPEFSGKGKYNNSGLETARSVYQIVAANTGLTAAQIADRAQISESYAKQIVLALQNGGVAIAATPIDSGDRHRHQHLYSIEQ